MTSNEPGIPRANTVVLFNDMLKGLVDVEARRARNEETGFVRNCARLVARAREAGLPIFWIRVGHRADAADMSYPVTDAYIAAGFRPPRHLVDGSRDAENVDELPILEGDQVIHKPRRDPFRGTDLDIQLRARGITTILLGGVATSMGVESCARTATDLGYNVVVLSDCCDGPTAEQHEWSLSRQMPMFARVMDAERALGLLE